jgi:hypothetical protein
MEIATRLPNQATVARKCSQKSRASAQVGGVDGIYGVGVGISSVGGSVGGSVGTTSVVAEGTGTVAVAEAVGGKHVS